MEFLIPIGISLIFLGFIIVMIGALFNSGSANSGADKHTKNDVAVGGFIGFIPFGFATDKRLFTPLLVMMLTVFVIWLVMFLRH